MSERAPKPMLCHGAPGKTVGAVPTDGTWVMEPKLDGWRWIMVRGADRVRSYAGRNGTEHTGEAPAIEAALVCLPLDTIIDGEMVGGSYSATVSSALANKGSLLFVAFDVLKLDGVDVTGC